MLFNEDRRILIFTAVWHSDLAGRAVQGCLDDLHAAGVPESVIDVVELPGALEMPTAAKVAAQSGRYAVIGCCGIIANGGIYHHEYVAHAVIDGLVRAGLDTGVPVLSTVLTPLRFNEHSKPDHEFFHDHLYGKGKELASAMLSIVPTLDRLSAGEPAGAV